MAKAAANKPKHRTHLDLSEFMGQNQRALKFAFDNVAPEMYVRMFNKCPVKTGDLRDSITIKPVTGKNPRMEVSTLFYGEYQDEDPGYRPFITPVFEMKMWPQKIAKYIREYMRTQTKKKAGK